MKKLFFLILLTLTTNVLLAQNIFPSTGNVGIGVVLPTYNLEVLNTGNATFRIGSSAATGYSDISIGKITTWKISKLPGTVGTGGTLAFTYNTNVYGGDRPVLTLNHRVGSWDAQFGTTDPNLFGGFANFVVDGGMAAQRLVLSSINTPAMFSSGSSYILIANGKIGAREVVVSAATSFPDYVFTQDYKLLPLTDVEKYIKENSRLPEMPSATEVEKNGLELGRINILLVQKVEELTLHLIELNKKIERLEAASKALDSSN